MSKSELHNWECAIEKLSGDNADKMLAIAQDIYNTAFVRGKNYISLVQEPCEDCISRQAILGIIHFEDNWLYDAQSHNANTVIAFSGLKSKVKALPSVNPQEQEPILDKIRAEIEQVKSIMNDEIINHDRKDLINFVNGLNQSLVIIDKYKAESEVQDDL